MLSGHVFIVLADLADVAYDAVILPADSAFSVRDHWRRICANPKRPSDYDAQHYGLGEDGVWWVDVTLNGEPDRYALQQNLASCLDAVAAKLGRNARVALPVLGGAGLDHEVDDAQNALLNTLRKAAEHHQLDLLLVTHEQWRYGRLQAIRLTDPARWFPGIAPTGASGVSLELASALGEFARAGELSLLLGADVGTSAGLPSTSELIEQIGRDTTLPPSLSAADMSAMPVAERSATLRRLNPKFAETIAKASAAIDKPGLTHFLLAGLGTQQAATTGYDDAYQRAVRSPDPAARELAVLPYQRPRDGQPWLLRLRGDHAHPDDITFTSSPLSPATELTGVAVGIFQSLPATTHLLAVATAVPDDDALRLVRPVYDYLRADSPIGTVLTLAAQPARASAWGTELQWVRVHRPGDLPHRLLDIFLDAVGMYSRSEPAKALDERFDDQLGSTERDLAVRLRGIAGEVEKQGGRAWQGVRDAFAGLGYRDQKD